MTSREEKAAQKMADTFADDRLNVVQLGHHTAMGFTPNIISKIRGWLHWHDHISERMEIRQDGGIDYIDGEYLEYIKKQNNRPY